MAKEIIYSGVNPNYARNLKPIILTNEDAVNAQIENCLGIMKGEVWFEPTQGSDIHRYIFEPITDASAAGLYMEVIASLREWMPTLQLERGTGVLADRINKGFRVYVVWSMPGSGLHGKYEGFLTSVN